MFWQKKQTFGHHIANTGHHLVDHFWPNHRNNHHPHAIRHHVLAGYSAVLVLLKVLVVTAAVTLPAASVYSSAITRANIISLTNSTRAGAGLPALIENGLLNNAAQSKASDMLTDQYFAHTSPDGLTPWSFINGAGYYYQYAGENLAVHYTSAEGVLSGWMASPSHRANIVDDRYSEIGVGISNGVFEDYNTTFVVQMFGHRPGYTAPEPAPTPEPESTPEPAPTSEPVQEEPEPEPVTEEEQEPETVVGSQEPTEPPAESDPGSEDSLIVESALILPAENGYEIAVEAQNAISAEAQMGETAVALEKNPETGTWFGFLAAKEAGKLNGQEISIALTNVQGETSVEPIAWVGPQDLASLYAYNQNTEPFKLFGVFPLNHLNDTVNVFYVATMVILGFLLAVSILVKVEVQHHATLAHGLFVIVGAAILLVI